MNGSCVVLTGCKSYDRVELCEAIHRQFELLGGVESFIKPGHKVLIKPNFIAPRSHRHATQTHPSVVVEIARFLKDFGAKPFVGDSPAWNNIYTCAEKLELDQSLKELGVPIRQLNKPRKCRIGKGGLKVGISSVALDADVIINLPKFKTHQQLVATFAVKNMFGCVSGKKKVLWHFRKGAKPEVFCELLIDIYRHLSPAVTIIDGIMAMDGQGPIRGRTRPLGWLIGGTDPLACEIICSKLVNIDWKKLPIVATAAKMGYGCTDPEKIKILGDSLPIEPCKDFELAMPIPIRFSLAHVCKSVCKQVFFMTKSVLNRGHENSE